MFVDTVDVNLINVDVYVTDRDGQRVTGLTKDDFELLEDGRPIRITNFYAVEDGKPVVLPEEAQAAGTPVAPPPDEPPSPTRLDELPVPEDQRLHLIVYIDNLFIRPFNRNKVVREVRRFLHGNLKPQDQVMLVTFDRSIHVRHPFTSDMNAIGAALYELEELTGFAVQAASERREFLRRIDETKDVLEAEQHAQYYAESLHHDLTTSINALKDLTGSLAGIPGRKALLYVSDGLPMTPGQDLYFVVDQRFTGRIATQLRANRFSARRPFRELTAQANANRVTFYTLGAAGMSNHESLSAEYGGSNDPKTGLTGGSRIEADFMRLSDYSEPLQVMAADTGGLATFNTNNFTAALGNMATDFQSYYSLGYLPAHSGDGRFHDIQVRVKRPELTARHRQGYRDKTSEARVAEGTLAALLYGVESNPLNINLVIEPERRRDDGQFLVPILVRVPLGRLTLIPQQGQHLGQFRVSLAAIDDDRALSPIEQHSVPVAIPEADLETARKQYYVYSAELLMRAGSQQIAVGVRDEFAGEISFVRQVVQIGRR